LAANLVMGVGFLLTLDPARRLAPIAEFEPSNPGFCIVPNQPVLAYVLLLKTKFMRHESTGLRLPYLRRGSFLPLLAGVRAAAILLLAVSAPMLPAREAPGEFVPIFRYAILYDGLLEFTTCATMTNNGRIHANGPIYTGSSARVTFNDTVTTASAWSTPAWGGQGPSWIYTGVFNGSPPLITNVPPVLLADSTNLHGIIEMPPSGEDPASDLGGWRLYNQAQIVLLTSNSSVTLRIQTCPDCLTPPGGDPSPINLVAFYNPTNRSPTNFLALSSRFPFLSVTNTFTDQREAMTILASQIDVGIYAQWLRTNPMVLAKYPSGIQNYPALLYVADNRTRTDTQLAVVRLVNGVAPPVNGGFGFSVATPNPLYVVGNYNCTNPACLGTTNTSATVPCALMSDALTILSQNWKDAASVSNFISRPAANTTINAAILTGNVPSTGPGMNSFSGGVHNLPRLLEDWNSAATRRLTLNTSLVCLYSSTIATHQFCLPGAYYDPPIRLFSFDPNFQEPAKLPPGTPVLILTNITITGQPQNQTVPAGETVVLNVTGSDPLPMNYQWYCGDTCLVGCTSACLTLTGVQASQAGVYRVKITDPCSFVGTMSSDAVLTVTEQPPIITSQPQQLATLVGHDAVFTVQATGTSPMLFQWQFNATNLVDATNSTLSLNSVTSSQAGNYSVVITSQAGSVTSSNAFLSVYSSAASVLNSFSLSAGNQAQLGVAGVPGLNYIVQGSTNLIDWVPLLTNVSPFTFADTNAAGFPQRFYRAVFVQ
jgi:hypothetical protein